MKLARLHDGSLALVIRVTPDVALLDVAAALDVLDATQRRALTTAIGEDARSDWCRLIESWEDLREPLEQLVEAGERGDVDSVIRSLDDVRLSPPLPSAHVRIFALGGNFNKHIVDASRVVFGDSGESETASLDRRREQGPWGFLILPETVVGPEDEIRPPDGLTKIDYEGEVAVVLAKGGRGISASDLRIWGFTAWNDFSLRDSALGVGPAYDRGPMNWTLQKNFDSGSSCGPWLVVDEPFDVDRLRITLRVNDETRQDGLTSDMIFSFGETAEHLSQFLTLKPGDVIASGTPDGTALESGIDGPFLTSGDVTEVEVQGVGLLRNRIVMG